MIPKMSLRERIFCWIFRRRIERLSEYSTHLACAQGLLDAAQTHLPPDGEAVKCVIEANEACELVLNLIYRDMDALCDGR